MSSRPDPGNCGLPDGAYHFHTDRCWQAGHDTGYIAGHTAALTPPEPADQVWQRPLRTWPGPASPTDGVVLHLTYDDTGRAHVHEAVLAQLLIDAGWERIQ